MIFFLHFATESFVNTIYTRQRDDRLNTKINLKDDFTKVNATIYALFLDKLSRNLYYSKNPAKCMLQIYETFILYVASNSNGHIEAGPRFTISLDWRQEPENGTSGLLLLKSLSFIYFTSIIQKAHGTYIRVLEGADVGVMWSNVVEKTGQPRENHRAWSGDHYPATCLLLLSGKG